jgi:hypothetical protein
MQQALAVLPVKLELAAEECVAFLDTLKKEVLEKFLAQQVLQTMTRHGAGVVRLVSKCVTAAVNIALADLKKLDKAVQRRVLQGVLDGYDIGMLDLMAELRNCRSLAHMKQIFISDFPYDLILEAFDYTEWQRLRDVAHSRIQLVLEAEALTEDLMLREEEAAAQLRRGLPAEEQISTEKRPTEHAAQVQLSIFTSFCFLLKARLTSILFVQA